CHRRSPLSCGVTVADGDAVGNPLHEPRLHAFSAAFRKNQLPPQCHSWTRHRTLGTILPGALDRRSDARHGSIVNARSAWLRDRVRESRRAPATASAAPAADRCARAYRKFLYLTSGFERVVRRDCSNSLWLGLASPERSSRIGITD